MALKMQNWYSGTWKWDNPYYYYQTTYADVIMLYFQQGERVSVPATATGIMKPKPIFVESDAEQKRREEEKHRQEEQKRRGEQEKRRGQELIDFVNNNNSPFLI